MPELILKEEVYQIVGAAMDVYYRLGRGFLEPVYQEALEIELGRRGIPFEAQCRLTIYYKEQPLGKLYVADLICFDQIIAELKVCERLSGAEQAQIINYLKATQKKVGLLLNFGSPLRLEWKRYVIWSPILGASEHRALCLVRVGSCDFVDRMPAVNQTNDPRNHTNKHGTPIRLRSLGSKK